MACVTLFFWGHGPGCKEGWLAKHTALTLLTWTQASLLSVSEWVLLLGFSPCYL